MATDGHTTYLSRLILDPRSREVRRDLGDCHELHATVMSAFPNGTSDDSQSARSALGILYRVDRAPGTRMPVLLVQSRVEPDWTRLPAGYLAPPASGRGNLDHRPIDDAYASIQSGMRLRFRLRANPTRKIDTKTGPDGKKRNGRRVELRGEEQQVEWLTRKAATSGFRVVQVSAAAPRPIADVQVAPSDRLTGRRRDGSRITVVTVQYDGLLEVTDTELFRSVLDTGIGPAKAYGCGLLSIAPAA